MLLLLYFTKNRTGFVVYVYSLFANLVTLTSLVFFYDKNTSYVFDERSHGNYQQSLRHQSQGWLCQKQAPALAKVSSLIFEQGTKTKLKRISVIGEIRKIPLLFRTKMPSARRVLCSCISMIRSVPVHQWAKKYDRAVCVRVRLLRQVKIMENLMLRNVIYMYKVSL